MNGTAGTVVRILLVLAGLWVAWKVVGFIVSGLLSLIIPIAIVGGVYLALTRTNAGRALIGGRRSLP